MDLMTMIAPSCWPSRVDGSEVTTDEMHFGQIFELNSSPLLEIESQSSP